MFSICELLSLNTLYNTFTVLLQCCTKLQCVIWYALQAAVCVSVLRIREVAMTGLQEITELLLASDPEYISADVYVYIAV